MASGTQTVGGALDFQEVAPVAPPVGTTRIARVGGQLIIAADGGVFSMFSPMRLAAAPRVLTADATSVTFAGLADADGEGYEWLIQGVGGAGVVTHGDILLQPNGVVGTNQACQALLGGTNNNLGNLYAGGHSLAGISYGSQGVLLHRQGTSGRSFVSQGTFQTVGAVRTATSAGGTWNDNTAITSLTFTTSQANGFGIGTRISLYAMRAQ